MQIKTLSKSEFENHLKNAQIFYTFYKTSAGQLTLFFTDFGIFKAVFEDIEIPKSYIFIEKFNGSIQKLLLVGTDFQLKVWQRSLHIPDGKTISYKELAEKLGNVKAVRAVANALSKNKIAYFIPCHRVIGSDGSLTGYRWGIEKKKKLLQSESAI